MREITSLKDLELYKPYVIRDNKLYMLDSIKKIPNGEIYCSVGTTPSTPADIVLYRDIRDDNTMAGFNTINEVINMDYYNPIGIKNFILDPTDFKDWWEIK